MLDRFYSSLEWVGIAFTNKKLLRERTKINSRSKFRPLLRCTRHQLGSPTSRGTIPYAKISMAVSRR